MNSEKIVADGWTGRDGKIEGSTRGPRGPKNKTKCWRVHFEEAGGSLVSVDKTSGTRVDDAPSRKHIYIKFLFETSHELRMLSRSLSDCKSLTPNVMIQVSQFVSNSKLCHLVTKSLSI